ncbi:hypothetical protein CHUAL_014198 [Chamberlinius hualienensis]
MAIAYASIVFLLVVLGGSSASSVVVDSGVKLALSSRYQQDEPNVYNATMWVTFSDFKANLISSNSAPAAIALVKGSRLDTQNGTNKYITVINTWSLSDKFLINITLRINNVQYFELQPYAFLSTWFNQWPYHISLLYAVPELRIVQGENGIIGNDAVIECIAPPGTPLYWILPGNSTKRTNDTYSIDYTVSVSVSTLKLRTSSKDSFSTFKCCAEMKDDQLTNASCGSIVLPLKSPPVLQDFSQNCNSNSCELNCTFVGDLNVNQLRWQGFNGNRWVIIPSTSVYTYENRYEMSLQTTDWNRYLTYKCDATAYTITASQFFTAAANYFSPIVTAVGNTYSDNVLTMTCQINCNPSLTKIYWIKDYLYESSSGSDYIDTASVASFNRYSLNITNMTTSDDDDFTYETNLSITNYSTSDRAIFHCVAENDGGIGTANTTSEIISESVLESVFQPSLIASTNNDEVVWTSSLDLNAVNHLNISCVNKGGFPGQKFLFQILTENNTYYTTTVSSPENSTNITSTLFLEKSSYNKKFIFICYSTSKVMPKTITTNVTYVKAGASHIITSYMAILFELATVVAFSSLRLQIFA